MAPSTPAPRFITEWRTVDPATGEAIHHKNWRTMQQHLADHPGHSIEKRHVHRSTWKPHIDDLPQTVALRQHRSIKEARRCDAIRGVLAEHWGTDATIDELTRRIDAAIKKAAEQ